MHARAALVIALTCLGCAKKKQEAPPAPGSAKVAADAASTSSGSGSGSGDVAAIDAGVATDAAAPSVGCIPDGVGHFGRMGADLVGCIEADAQCWTIDPKTGAVTPRAAAHFPGVGFTVEAEKLKKPGCYEDLCWTVPKREDDEDPSRLWVAFHPDGKRVAILDDPAGTIFDLATKKPIATFKADLGNSLGGLWFVGNFVIDAGYDAGPYAVLVYHDAKTGKKVGTFEDFFGGSFGVSSTGAAIVAGEDMTTVSVIDGASYKGKTTKRKIPKAPKGCAPMDPGLDTESEDPKDKACAAFAKTHYFPYSDATLVDDPAGGYVGLQNDQLFTVDKNLVETSRVKIALCPHDDDK